MKKLLLLILAFNNFLAFSQSPEQKLINLGIELPNLEKPIASYVDAVRVGNTIYLSGKGPRKNDGTFITGKVGVDLTIEEAKKAAKLTAINQLATLKKEIGSLNNVKQIVKVFGMVNCTNEFTQHPFVINEFSNLMVEVFGENGKHARSAVGMSSLPFNIAVEIEMIVEVKD